uniref:Structure-specific endonuclease subunit SLX1 homolog n=2 Tax=Clastoptera arizonana TaxID=38151 RepID=A0A1B6BX28_9HEMI
MNCVLETSAQESDCNIVENFFGVYLLYCMNPKYKGRTYIGYTVNPNRRINQHNKGQKSGGARKTSNRGPWEMVLIVHGFPNDISALRFEWAWQNPKKSRRLRNLKRKTSKENQYEYCLRILLEMLRIGPWNRLPLTIRWLVLEFEKEFLADRCPPMHMPIAYGSVVTKKVTREESSDKSQTDHIKNNNCNLCYQTVKDQGMKCLKPDCESVFHIICLSKHFCECEGNNEQIIPISGNCPMCDTFLLWGDLVQNKVVFSKRFSLNDSCLEENIFYNQEIQN